MNKNDIHKLINDVCPGCIIEPVGSRITCNPPPEDTDIDYLVFVPEKKMANLLEALDLSNWTMLGSNIAPETRPPVEDRFHSYRLDEYNLIMTSSESFFAKFMAATHVAKELNLLDKRDRIVMFQAMLYGNLVNKVQN
jgi:hypothetical protein